MSGPYHHPETGEYVGFIWKEYALSGAVEYHVEDWRGEKRPQPLMDEEACKRWLEDRAKAERRAA